MALDYYRQLKIHPLALSFPEMPPEEFEALKVSIKEHGLFEPIILGPDGDIIDGRHRWKACIELGIEPFTSNFVEQQEAAGQRLSVEEYIFEANFNRRHLNDDQRGAVTAVFLPYLQNKAAAAKLAGQVKGGQEHAKGSLTQKSASSKKRDRKVSDARSTVGQLASKAKVGRHKAAQTKKIAAKQPELLPAIASGKITLRDAEKIINNGAPASNKVPSVQERFAKISKNWRRKLVETFSATELITVKTILQRFIEEL